MRSQFQFAILTTLTAAVLMPRVMNAQARSAKSRTVAATPAASTTQATVLATSVSTGLKASPGTISFSATDPDLGAVTGSSASTVTFTLKGGANARTWSVGIQAGSSTFTGCTTLPASAVTATCSSVTITHNSGATPTAGTCSAAFALSSTSSTTVASGEEGGGNTFSILINFTLSDSWQNIAATSPTCPLTLTYSLNAP
jgi:hypothetical protein